MTILILTRQGLERLLPALQPDAASLLLNPGLIDADEAARLRQEGFRLTILEQPVAVPGSALVAGPLAGMAEKAGMVEGEPLWVECLPPAGVLAVTDAAGTAGVAGSAGIAEIPGAGSAAPAPMPANKGARRFRRALAGVRGGAAAVSRYALHGLRRFAAGDGPALIIPYMGFGTTRRVFLQGRVLRDEGFATPDPGDSAWTNFIELTKRLGSNEIPGARVRVQAEGLDLEVVADAHGYFSIDAERAVAVTQTGWLPIDVELVHPAPPPGRRIHATGQILVPPPGARFGIISDIDDTVLWSNVTNKLRMLALLAASNAHTRKPFKGVAAFYQALRDGCGGDEGNPLFYVSSSPWHLYTPLVDFLQTQEIPLGPLMLKPLGMRALLASNRHHDHKLGNIERILSFYPELPFVLIGDSGQHDPEIYKEVVERYPQRVRAIYIRNVDPNPERIDALDRLIDEVRSTGAQLVLAPDSEYAAAHAAGEGLIHGDRLAVIRSDKRDDSKLSNPKV